MLTAETQQHRSARLAEHQAVCSTLNREEALALVGGERAASIGPQKILGLVLFYLRNGLEHHRAKRFVSWQGRPCLSGGCGRMEACRPARTSSST